jgi:hypothetical protein
MRLFTWRKSVKGILTPRTRRTAPLGRGNRARLCLEQLEARTLLSTITWANAGSGKFDVGSNWTGGVVPGGGDTAVINTAAAATITIQSGDHISVQSITTASNDTLANTGGSLAVTTGTSTLSGPLALTGGTLEATGSGVNLTANSGTTVSEANLFARNGATLSLPQLTSSVSNGTFQADSPGSVLDVSALTTLTQTGGWSVNALTGGTVKLTGLTSLTSTHGIFITDTGGSTLLDGNLTSLSRVDATLDGTDAAVANSWTKFTGGQLEVDTGSYSLAGLTDVDSSNLFARFGGSLALPGLTSYAANGTFQADGTNTATGKGSVLDVSALTTLTQTGGWSVNALTGGTVKLTGLTSLTSTHGIFITDTGGSTLLDGNLTSLSGVTASLDGTDAAVANSWTKFTGGQLEVDTGSYSLAGLTDVNSSNLFARFGGSLALPGLTSYAANGTFQADGTNTATGKGSVLDVSALTTLTQTGGWSVNALSGGTVKLTGLTTLTSTHGIFITDTGGSTLLDGNLTSFNGVNATLDGTDAAVANSWTKFTGGQLEVDTGSYSLAGLTDVDSSNLFARFGGSLALPGLTSYAANGTFQADGTNTGTGKGSVLDVSALTTLTQTGGWSVNALTGGTVKLTGLTSLTSTHGIFITDTGNSTIVDSKLTGLNAVSATLDGSDAHVADSWTAFTNGDLSITGGSYTLAKLTDVFSSALSVQNGATLTLPGLTWNVSQAGTIGVSAGGTLTETGTLPSGVSFTDNGGGTGTLKGTPASGTAGTYSYMIAGSGGSLVLTLTVAASTPAATTTTLSSDHASGATYGQTVTITAAVSAASGTPTGAVQFFVNGSADGSAVTLSGGMASIPLTGLAVGSYALTASYTSDTPTAFANSTTAGPLTQAITAAPLTITADNQTKAVGAAVPPLTVHYTGFVNGDTPASLTTAPTVTTTATASSPAGSYPITASGAVDPNYTISYVAGTLTVTSASAAATTTVLSSDHASGATYGQTVTITAAVSAASGTPTGAVQFFVNGTADGTPVTLSGGTASLPLTGLAAGSYALTASYTSNAPTVFANSTTAGPLTQAIAPAPLTITADNQTKAVGAAVPTLTVHYTGFVNGDTAASLTTAPTATTTATASSPAGSYPITASGAVDANYTIGYVAGTLTVTSASAAATTTVLSSDHASGATYGQTVTITAAVSAASGTPTGAVQFFVNGTADGSAVTLSGGTASLPLTGLAVGSYALTASYTSDTPTAFANSTTAGPLTQAITPAPLTVTADPQTMVYGGTFPTLTVHYTGFVNGDTAASLTTAPTIATTATATSAVGAYPIGPSGAVDANYSITYVAGTLTVTPAPLTVTADNQTKAYGAPLPALTVHYTGFVNGDTAAKLTTAPTVGTTATAKSGVGTYPLTPSGAVDLNYNITYAAGTLTVTAVPLTITADAQTMVYGGTFPTLTVHYTGFVNGDTAASLTTAPTVVTTATASSPVGSYPITASAAVDANYTISYVAGTLTITPAPLTITAANQTKAYGAALPALTVQYTGFVNGDTAASLTTAPTVATTATAASGVGSYPITASGAVDANYSITYVAGTLTVTAVPLTITADAQTMIYGGTLPALTVHYTGFVNGDTAASLTTAPTVVTTATASSPVGSYPITVGGAVDANYTITSVAGTLTITPAPLTITAANQTKAYGAALPALTVQYTGFVNGDTAASLTTAPTVATTATAASGVGSYPITASGAVDANYSITYVAGTLTVTAVPLLISADPQTMVYGGPLPALTVHYTGFVNGDTVASLTTAPTVVTTATVASGVGSYPITASAAVDANYKILYTAATLTVTPAPLLISADNQTAVHGAPLPTLTFQISGFVNGDTEGSLSTPVVVLTTATSSSPAGTYPITVSNASAANYTITFVPGVLTITQATAHVLVSPSLHVAVPGQPITYTVTVSAVAPATGTPTGTVTLTGLPGGARTLTLRRGTAVFTVAAPLGRYSVHVAYAGDRTFPKSTAPAEALTVENVAVEPDPRHKGKSLLVTGTTAGKDLILLQVRHGKLTLEVVQLTGGHAHFSGKSALTGLSEVLIVGPRAAEQVVWVGKPQLPVAFQTPLAVKGKAARVGLAALNAALAEWA